MYPNDADCETQSIAGFCNVRCTAHVTMYNKTDTAARGRLLRLQAGPFDASLLMAYRFA